MSTAPAPSALAVLAPLRVVAIDLSGDGAHLAVATNDGRVGLVDPAAGTLRWLLPAGGPVATTLAFGDASALLLVGYAAADALLIDIRVAPASAPAPAVNVQTLPGSGAVNAGLALADGLVLTGAPDESVRQWRRVPGQWGAITPASTPNITPAGTLVDADGQPRRARALGRSARGAIVLMRGFAWTLLDPTTTQELQHFDLGHLELADQPDGLTGLSRTGRFAYHYWDDFLIWSSGDGQPVLTGHRTRDALCGALSDNGRALALGDRAGQVCVLTEDPLPVHQAQVAAVPVVRTAIDDEARMLAWLDLDGRVGWAALGGS